MATWQEALDDASTETEHDTWDHTGLTGVGGGAFVGVRVYNDATQSIANASWAALSFNSERFDTNTFHDTGSNTSRLTVPSGQGGYYLIGGAATFDNHATGLRFIRILLNGTDIIAYGQSPASSAADTRLPVGVTLYALDEADYVELQVNQTSGGSLDSFVNGNATPEFWMYKVG